MKQRKRRKLKTGRISQPRLSALEGSSESPLHAAAWAGDVEWARELIASGLSPSFVDSAGETPLHGAAAWGHAPMVELLLKAGAPVNLAAAATRGFTALHWAAGWGNLDTVKALLAGGADPRIVDAHGASPERIAKEHNRHDAAAHLRAFSYTTSD